LHPRISYFFRSPGLNFVSTAAAANPAKALLFSFFFPVVFFGDSWCFLIVPTSECRDPLRPGSLRNRFFFGWALAGSFAALSLCVTPRRFFFPQAPSFLNLLEFVSQLNGPPSPCRQVTWASSPTGGAVSLETLLILWRVSRHWFCFFPFPVGKLAATSHGSCSFVPLLCRTFVFFFLRSSFALFPRASRLFSLGGPHSGCHGGVGLFAFAPVAGFQSIFPFFRPAFHGHKFFLRFSVP